MDITWGVNVTIKNLRIMIIIYWNPPQFEVASDFDIQQNMVYQHVHSKVSHSVVTSRTTQKVQFWPPNNANFKLAIDSPGWMMHQRIAIRLVLYRFYQQPKQQPTTETNPTDRNPLQVHGDPKAALDTANENIAFVLSFLAAQTPEAWPSGSGGQGPGASLLLQQGSSYNML